MRTRSQSNRGDKNPQGPRDSKPQNAAAEGSRCRREKAIALEAAGSTSKRARSCKESGAKRREEDPPLVGESKGKGKALSKNKSQGKVKEELICDFGMRGCTTGIAEGSTSIKGVVAGDNVNCDVNEMEWEEGTIPTPVIRERYSHELGKEVTVEFTDSPSSAQKKPSRRVSAADKELAELVHKVHLLCLLARGRIVDSACNDPLIQASLLSLLPTNLLKIEEVPKLTASTLCSLANWFQNNFRVRTEPIDRGSFKLNLAFALETHEGTAEEVAALSVALFRALNLTTRFVSVLDVASVKPDAIVNGSPNQDTPKFDPRMLTSAATVVSGDKLNDQYLVGSVDDTRKDLAHETCKRDKHHKKEHCSSCKKNLLEHLANTCLDVRVTDSSASKELTNNLDSCSTDHDERLKRKGDMEFELQMEMALSATAAGARDNKVGSNVDELHGSSVSIASPLKKLRTTKIEGPSMSTRGSSSAVWSRRIGPPLHWAEVYSSGETLTGRWVHVDAANAVVDGEDKVEAAAAAYRRPLKYVVAFAGNGAKDVTRRYCVHWYKIASQRINSQWWDTVLAPLKELESGATGGKVHLEAFKESSSEMEKTVAEVPRLLDMDAMETTSKEFLNHANLAGEHGLEPLNQLRMSTDLKPPAERPGISCRNSLEDMELETRALTEPLPTNQLAYKKHHLYALERWLAKNQILHPKGPVLGYCSGHPVYPRSCVQTLQTRQKWLREGLQVRANEIPAKVVQRSKNFVNLQTADPSVSEEDYSEPTVELFGKWQLEPLRLPRAVNGIVPKNERGQVDVWSEKCLPSGTVHLRFPYLARVARRLEIDFAPAMVGFEYRSGRCLPVFDGIVVCTEFKNAVFEAYAEEQEKREAEERKQNEAEALSRWFQLLSSIITRQRLKNSYSKSSLLHSPHNPLDNQKCNQYVSHKNSSEGSAMSEGTSHELQHARPILASADDHEHVFPVESQSFDEDNLVRTKRCPCGFSIQVEEL